MSNNLLLNHNSKKSCILRERLSISNPNSENRIVIFGLSIHDYQHGVIFIDADGICRIRDYPFFSDMPQYDQVRHESRLLDEYKKSARNPPPRHQNQSLV